MSEQLTQKQEFFQQTISQMETDDYFPFIVGLLQQRLVDRKMDDVHYALFACLDAIRDSLPEEIRGTELSKYISKLRKMGLNQRNEE